MIVQPAEPKWKARTQYTSRFLVTILKEIVIGAGDAGPEEISERHKIDSKQLLIYPAGLTVSAWTDQFGNNYLFDPNSDYLISVTAHEHIDFERHG